METMTSIMTIGKSCRRLCRGLRLLWPWFMLARLTSPIPPGLWLANVFMQRILRINGSVSWMVHFTSCANGKIQIGKDVWKSFALSGGCYIQGGNGICIGDGTIFAPGVKIVSANHDPNNMSSWKAAPPIRIGCRCWIASNAVILPGVQLGDDVTVGAGAVVTRSFPSGSTIGGVPAKLIATRSIEEGLGNDDGPEDAS